MDLLIEVAYEDKANHPNLCFLGTTLKALCLDRLLVDSDLIPITVIKIHLERCSNNSGLNFKAFTNLTRFVANYCSDVGDAELPPLIIELEMPDVLCEASMLSNLDHVSGSGITNLPWSQLKSASLVKILLG